MRGLTIRGGLFVCKLPRIRRRKKKKKKHVDDRVFDVPGQAVLFVGAEICVAETDAPKVVTKQSRE